MTLRPHQNLLLLLATTVAFTGVAVAQERTESVVHPPVRYLEGNEGIGGFSDGNAIRLRTQTQRGINAGDFLIWPALKLEGRYDSNIFQSSDEETPQAVPMLRIMPGIALTNPASSKLAFSLGAEADVRVYLSENEALQALTNAGVKGDLRVDILPTGPVTVSIFDVFRRTLNARRNDTSQTYNLNQNMAALRVNIHPGAGALDIALGYAFNVSLYDDFEQANSMSHDMLFRTTWRFYPKTLALLEARGNFRDWETDSQYEGLYVDNKSFRVFTGLSGYITRWLGTLLKVGYGNSFHDAGSSYESVVGQAELQFRINPSILIAAGYSRDFQNSFYANFFTENKGYLRSQMRFGGRVGLDLTAGYHLIDFSEFDPAALDPTVTVFVSHKERRDQHISGHAKVDVDITRWIGMTVGYEVRAVFSNFRIENSEFIDSELVKHIDYGGYVRHQVYGSINVRY